MKNLLAVAAALSLAAPSLAQTADTIYVNGTVHTADDARPTATAIAVLGDTIVGVGSTDDMAAHWGTSTVLIDLAINRQ